MLFSKSLKNFAIPTVLEGLINLKVKRFFCVNSKSRMLFLSRLVLIATLFSVNGCVTMLGPDYVRPEPPRQDEWVNEEDVRIKSETDDYSNWWTIFNDTILTTLVKNAYEQYLPLRIAGIRILEARAQLGVAIGDKYPQLQRLQGAYSRKNLSENAPNSGLADQAFGEYGFGFDSGWEVDFWGKFRRGVEASIGDLEASIANYDDILVTLTSEVARTYVLMRTFEARLDVRRENVKVQERSLQIAQAQFTGGAVTELDVQQAKSLLHDTQALIPSLESGVRRAKNALAVLLGTLPGKIDNILNKSGLIPPAPDKIAVGLPAELLRRRPDIRLAERQVAAQSSRIGVAKTDMYPHFSLLGSIGLRTGDSNNASTQGRDVGDLFESDSIEFSAGPSFQWDILNYGQIRNKIRVQDARLQQAIVNYKNTVLDASLEVENAMIDFLRSQEEEMFLDYSVKASKRSVDLSLLQYREGLVSYQRVLDTQRFLTQQQDRLHETTGSVSINLIAIYKSLGGGWQIRKGNDFVPIETRKQMKERTNWGDLLMLEEIKTPPSEEYGKKRQLPDW